MLSSRDSVVSTTSVYHLRTSRDENGQKNHARADWARPSPTRSPDGPIQQIMQRYRQGFGWGTHGYSEFYIFSRHCKIFEMNDIESKTKNFRRLVQNVNWIFRNCSATRPLAGCVTETQRKSSGSLALGRHCIYVRKIRRVQRHSLKVE